MGEAALNPDLKPLDVPVIDSSDGFELSLHDTASDIEIKSSECISIDSDLFSDRDKLVVPTISEEKTKFNDYGGGSSISESINSKFYKVFLTQTSVFFI